jgi:NitT/TauT family transport system substrate-binding protein
VKLAPASTASALAAVLCLSLASCSSGGSGPAAAEGPGEPMTLRVAVAAPGLPFLQLYVADDQGFYSDRNLTVEFVTVEGSAAATAALQSGSADATISLPEGAVTAVAAGAPLTIIGTTVDQNLYSMYGAPDIESLEDLEGKSVAILTEGNGTEIQARRVLDEEGAGAEASTYVATGGLPNRLAAVTEGQVAGTLLFPPFDLLADDAGLPNLYRLADLGVEYPNEVIAVAETALSENADALQAFMDALVEASAFIRSDFDKAVEIGTTVTGSPEDQVRRSMEGMLDSFSDDLSVSEESLESLLDSVERYGAVSDLPTADELYDDRFIG